MQHYSSLRRINYTPHSSKFAFLVLEAFFFAISYNFLVTILKIKI